MVRGFSRRRWVAASLMMVLLLVAAGCVQGPAPRVTAPAEKEATPAVDFSGKTIEIIINYTAGGPTDTFNRLIAQHVGKFIPGNPTIVPKNVAGAAGMIGINTLYNSPRKDGTVIGGFTTGISQQITGDPGAKYDIKKFEWVAAIYEAQSYWIRADVGVTKPEDFAKVSRQIKASGYSGSSHADLLTQLFLDAAGANFRFVPGYKGAAEAWKAVLQGEVDIFGGGLTQFQKNVRPEISSGNIVVVGQSGLLDPDGSIYRDPRLPDVPTTLEVAEAAGKPLTGDKRKAYELVVANRTLLQAILLPPGTDQAVVETMRQAYAKTFEDPAFKADAMKQLDFEFQFTPGEKAAKIAAGIVDNAAQNPEAVSVLRKMAGLE